MISLLGMLSMILFQHYLHVLPGAESSLGHMEQCCCVILLETTRSTAWLGLAEPFPSPLPEADHIQIPVFLAFCGPAELWSATRAGEAILLACHPEILLWIICGRMKHKHLANRSPGV